MAPPLAEGQVTYGDGTQGDGRPDGQGRLGVPGLDRRAQARQARARPAGRCWSSCCSRRCWATWPTATSGRTRSTETGTASAPLHHRCGAFLSGGMTRRSRRWSARPGLSQARHPVPRHHHADRPRPGPGRGGRPSGGPGPGRRGRGHRRHRGARLHLRRGGGGAAGPCLRAGAQAGQAAGAGSGDRLCARIRHRHARSRSRAR